MEQTQRHSLLQNNTERVITTRMNRFPLLPHGFRIPGFGLVAVGLIMAVIRFYYGIKPAVLDFKVFAISSSFFQTKNFVLINNNFSEEIAALLLLSGLFFIAFSSEKTENFDVQNIRLRSLLSAMILNSLLLIVSLFFVFGLSFVTVLVANMFSTLILYIILFKTTVYWYRRRKIP